MKYFIVFDARNFRRKMLSVHRGSKVVLSLCVCRLPGRYVEPDFVRKAREWKNEWETRTGNKLQIADGLAYLKTPGHFLPSIEEREKRMRSSDSDGGEKGRATSGLSEMELLLATEGIPELSMQAQDLSTEHKQDGPGLGKGSTGSGEMETETMQWLVVKYKSNPDVWTLPFTHRRGQEPAFDSLMRICKEQLGSNPHLPSMSPIAFREIVTDGPSTRMFYYKAANSPKSSLQLEKDSNIIEFEWVERATLATRLSRASWISIQNAIPLD